MEAEIILFINIRWAMLKLIHFLLLLVKEFLNSQSVYILKFFLINCLNWVSLLLHQMNQIHYLLFSHLQIDNLILKLAYFILILWSLGLTFYFNSFFFLKFLNSRNKLLVFVYFFVYNIFLLGNLLFLPLNNLLLLFLRWTTFSIEPL